MQRRKLLQGRQLALGAVRLRRENGGVADGELDKAKQGWESRQWSGQVRNCGSGDDRVVLLVLLVWAGQRKEAEIMKTGRWCLQCSRTRMVIGHQVIYRFEESQGTGFLSIPTPFCSRVQQEWADEHVDSTTTRGLNEAI